MDRWTEIQRKYEDTQALLHKSLAANEDLQGKLLEYKELNAQVEREWKHKYEQLSRDRDMIVETVKNGSERALQIVKHEYERKIQELQAQAKEDILKVDNARSHLQSKYAGLKAKYTQAHTTITDLKEVLHLAAEADSRKDSLIEELRVSTRDAGSRVQRDREALEADRDSLERERRELREQQLQLRTRAEEAEYRARELQARVEAVGAKLQEKTEEGEAARRDAETAKRTVRECQNECETLKDTANQVEAILRKEVDELRAEVEDLAEIVKVKDRMLDDQNLVISSVKASLKSKEEDLTA